MSLEFELIKKYFHQPTHHTLLGVGDDGALIQTTPKQDLVVSTDMLVEGTHFLSTAEPEHLGWKAMAVNISDMAAMAATPRWATLAITLPKIEELWLAAFARGFFACAKEFSVDMVGGDTTRGPLSFCVTILGEVPHRQALLRSGAKIGDQIWVSGELGLAALALAHQQGRCILDSNWGHRCFAALTEPRPRLALGLALRNIATAAIDISDGLLADLDHILRASNVAATLYYDQLPDAVLQAVLSNNPQAGPSLQLAQECLLSGGDDYELLFTVPAHHHSAVVTLASTLSLPLTCIGAICEGSAGTSLLQDAAGREMQIAHRGYDHFH